MSVSPDLAAFFGSGRKPHVVVTVGNTLRSDDGAGPYIAERACPKEGVVLINAGGSPENILEEVRRAGPGRITFIDAADFGGAPGDIRVIPGEAIPETTISTHAISLRLIARLLREDTGAEVDYLGIQPRSVEFGERLSPEVVSAAERIIAALSKKTGRRG